MRLKLIAVAAATFALGVGGVAQAAVDTTPPSITALSLAPASLDTSTEPAIVTVAATITDDVAMQSGDALVTLKSPSGKQTTGGMLFIADGEHWTGRVKIAAHSETGTWTVAWGYLK